ncbi:MAG: hypothetical protein KF900_13145 [Bacteroidetes bacterium]|nr:hypothetical protein [Bacteroidota bacterium]
MQKFRIDSLEFELTSPNTYKITGTCNSNLPDTDADPLNCNYSNATAGNNDKDFYIETEGTQTDKKRTFVYTNLQFTNFGARDYAAICFADTSEEGIVTQTAGVCIYDTKNPPPHQHHLITTAPPANHVKIMKIRFIRNGASGSFSIYLEMESTTGTYYTINNVQRVMGNNGMPYIAVQVTDNGTGNTTTYDSPATSPIDLSDTCLRGLPLVITNQDLQSPMDLSGIAMKKMLVFIN